MASARLLRLLPSCNKPLRPPISHHRRPSQQLPQNEQQQFMKTPRIVQHHRQQVWRQLASKHPWTFEEDEKLCRLVAESVLPSSGNGIFESDKNKLPGKHENSNHEKREWNQLSICPSRGVPWRLVARRLAEEAKGSSVVVRSPSACKTRFRWILQPHSSNVNQSLHSRLSPSSSSTKDDEKDSCKWTPEEEEKWTRVRLLMQRQRPLSMEALSIEQQSETHHATQPSSLNPDEKRPWVLPVLVDWGLISRYVGGRSIAECQQRLLSELSPDAHHQRQHAPE